MPETDKACNEEAAITRGGGERPFATYKCHYGFAKNATFYGIVAMVFNICKGAKFLMLYGLVN